MEIYLAGGCFWGVQDYFSKIEGINFTQCGYVNSNIENPTYEQVCTQNTNAAEAVKINFDEKKISLKNVLNAFFNIINPCSLNFQAGDVGSQYRSGIYVLNQDKDKLDFINKYIKENVQTEYEQKVVTEVMILKSYYEAETYHQNYLKKNVNGYCHINVESALKSYLKNKDK